MLERLPWTVAERHLTADAIVVIPLGAACKEHGPHLPLNNDAIIADYLTRRLVAQRAVAVLPLINYSYYPAFAEYPGSTSLRLETARDLVVDICLSVHRSVSDGAGPRRFYVLNTGVSTVKPLQAAAEALAREGVLLTFTDIFEVDGGTAERLSTQARGTHADEIETSMMLYMAPQVVDMSLAARDMPEGSGPLTRKPSGPGLYSPSGVYGDATLATREKGERIVEATVVGLLRDIDALRAAPLPQNTDGTASPGLPGTSASNSQ